MSRKKTTAAASSQAQAEPETYVAVRPLSYGEPEVRREAGEEVSDLPEQSITWLLAQGHIKLKGGDFNGR